MFLYLVVSRARTCNNNASHITYPQKSLGFFVSDPGLEIIDFWCRNGPLPPENLREKVGGFAPTFSCWFLLGMDRLDPEINDV